MLVITKDKWGLPGSHREGEFSWQARHRGCEAVCPLLVGVGEEAEGQQGQR